VNDAVNQAVGEGMRVRVVVFAVIAIALGALFVRLGFWQLDRLTWRRALNAEVASHMAAAPVPVALLPRDSAALRYRRAEISGVFDYTNQVVITQRIRGGSPGVNLLTPLRIPGRDTAYLVNRGWVYSPDGKTVNQAAWREADTVRLTAYALPAYSVAANTAGVVSNRVMRTLDVNAIQKDMPYPIARMQLIQIGDTVTADGVPPRVQPPTPDEGSHKSYAFQWFSFAAIAVIGAGIFAVTDKNRNRPRVDNT